MEALQVGAPYISVHKKEWWLLIQREEEYISIKKKTRQDKDNNFAFFDHVFLFYAD